MDIRRVCQWKSAIATQTNVCLDGPIQLVYVAVPVNYQTVACLKGHILLHNGPRRVVSPNTQVMART
jgi:hypothetical protein